MINNYLEYAKRWREFAIGDMRRYRRFYQEATGSWSRGFYKGLALSSSLEARKWRTLQKDIEARMSQGDLLGIFDPITHFVVDQLS